MYVSPIEPRRPAFRMIRGLGAAFILAMTSAPAHADALSDLVDRYIEWRGGAAFEHVTTVHERAKVETSGLTGTAESWVDRAGRERGDVDLGVIKQASVIDGANSWETTPSGQIQTMADFELKAERREQALAFGGALRGRDGATATLMPSEPRDGRTWAVVRVSFGDEDTYDAFIDAKTGELDGFRVSENRRVRFESFSDWRRVDEVRFPFLESIKTDLPGGDSVQHILSIDLNKPIDPARFARPGEVRRATFKAGAVSTGWIPFEFFDENRIYFPVRVNGHDTVALLDSGAETSIVDKAYAASIGLAPKGGFTTMGSGGTDTAGLVGGVKVEVGDMTLNDLTIGDLDMEPVAQRIGHPLPFVLGDEVFNELAIDIDFANRRIAFRDPAHLDKPAGAAEVPLRLTQGIRSVPASIEGAAPVQVDFDIGNGGALLVYPAYYEKAGMLKDRRTSQGLGGAIGGIHAETVATVRRLSFGGVDFTDVPAAFPPATNSAVNTNVAVGNIGLPIINRFHVIVDYSHDRLWLTPDPERVKASFARDRLGLSLVKRETNMTVEFVAPGSPAEAAGLKAGDKIILIDRKPPSAWPGSSLRSLGGQVVGTQVEFTLDGGGVRRVKLADYY